MKVTIIQRVLPHYRIPLFKLLQYKLNALNIDFQLVYGQEYPGTVPKTVLIEETWARCISNQYYNIGSTQLVWQPCLDVIKDSDLLIFEQANFLLLNYCLLLKRKWGGGKQLAYWGHGKNMQSAAEQSFSEKIKKALINQVDWWFGYTNLTKEVISDVGVPMSKITVLHNAVDTAVLKRNMAEISPDAIDLLRNSLDLPSGSIALYCGGMYESKKLDFLIESCIAIKARIPEFQLLLIGDGPEQHKAQHAAIHYEWIHYLGAKYGADKAIFFKIADVFLMPCLVGLAVLDSFTAGIPLFTTDARGHGPEIAYLKHGENGFVSEFSIEAYSDSITTYLTSNEVKKQQVKTVCLEDSTRYSIENMANRFVEGIQTCLAKVIQ